MTGILIIPLTVLYLDTVTLIPSQGESVMLLSSNTKLLFDVKWLVVVIPLLVTDMVYLATLVPGRANGGLHEMLTVERSIKEEDKAAFEGNEPVKKFIIDSY